MSPGGASAAYETAFLDWLACACAGSGERAAVAVRAIAGGAGDVAGSVAFAGTAGHVLDYDDTLPDGVAHVSATVAPAALVLAGVGGATVRDALSAFAVGWEAMAAVASASHPALYDGGWHPTAVCGPVGAAVAAAYLLGLDGDHRRHAIALALLRAGGGRGAFGSDGKAIQVGQAAAAGVQGALLAQAGASVDWRAVAGPVGWTAVTGARWTDPSSAGEPAILRNWIKLHPSCLGTHAPIDAAAQLGDRAVADLEVVVHPVARQAALLDAVSDGLSAKFSIPYCVAFTLSRGAPQADDFAAVDPGVARRAAAITVAVDDGLPRWGAVLRADGRELARVNGPRGAPGRPVNAGELRAKVRALVGDRLDGVLTDRDRPACDVLAAAGLRVR
jgi:2-methylcitrate dehydratase PrpD